MPAIRQAAPTLCAPSIVRPSQWYPIVGAREADSVAMEQTEK